LKGLHDSRATTKKKPPREARGLKWAVEDQSKSKSTAARSPAHDIEPLPPPLVGNLNRQWGKTASTFKPVNRHWNGPPSGLKRTRDPASCVWVVRLPGRCRCKVRCGAKRTAVKKSDSGLLRTRRHRPIDAKRELGSVHCHLRTKTPHGGRRQAALHLGQVLKHTGTPWTRLTDAGASSLFRLVRSNASELVGRPAATAPRCRFWRPIRLIERGSVNGAQSYSPYAP
jgi:hypothetical protein